jgi:uridylate kinase
MHKTKTLYVLSLGGSIIVPDGLNVKFLKQFACLIRERVKMGNRFVIITGGGATARRYIRDGGKISDIASEDLDWLGIHATRLNAHLLRTIFRDIAHPVVVKNPSRKLRNWSQPVLIGAGWRPGNSTDYIAVKFAKQLRAQKVINISNVEYLYDKDPNKYKDAKRVAEMSWKDYRDMVGDTWDPGMNLPFDPVASRLAAQSNMEVILVGGNSVSNIEKVLKGEKYKGSVIR